MNPLFRSTTVTVAALSLVVFSDCSSGVIAADHEQQQHRMQHTHNIQSHRGNQEEFGIGSSSSGYEGILDEDFVPPWRDPVSSPTTPSTQSPSQAPTSTRVTTSPTASPTTSPETASPTRSPTAMPVPIVTTPAPVEPINVNIDSSSGDVLITTFDEVSGARETSCVNMPAIGTFVTEVFDIEYFLYLDDEGFDDQNTIQSIVDSYIVPELHDALVDIGMGCNSVDFISNKNVMVDLMSAGTDIVGAQCLINSIGDDGSLANATSCYEVWGKVEATMWFSPRRQRHLQGSTTPFSDREAYNEFTRWMEEAFDSLGGGGDGLLKTSFQGFANVNGFDGTYTELSQDVGVDVTAAFMGTALSVDDSGINIVFGLIAVIMGIMVLGFVVVAAVSRRKRNHKAILEHTRTVEDLELDSKDELNTTTDVVVDDEELFREDRPLPENFKVKLETADHDYRWIGEDRKNPIFVATERNMKFQDHLNVLRSRKEQEQRERQYESVFL